MPSKRVAGTAAVWISALILAGCAKERPSRSYIQPNIIKKSDLTGQWYYAPTVVDVGYGTAVTFVGEVAWDISIIEWDIQKEVIFARLAYDRIGNTRQQYNGLDGETLAGEAIGAWKVEHFDVIREYNPTTGEEINVLKESKERPWFQREFIRVDWSENLVSNWNLVWQRAATIDPISYFATDPTHPHAPRLERDENDEVSFIGVTHKLLVTPDMRDIDFDFLGLSQIPDCFFFGTTTSCTSTEVTMRLAFAKKDPDHEYHPRDYTQREQDDFGFFLTQRLNYDEDRGVPVSGIQWYANTFNLYGEWYEKATDGTAAAQLAGAREYRCPDDGGPCRFTDDGSKIFLMGRQAFLSAEVPASVAEPVWCPCDAAADSCDKACFYVGDGSPVYVADPEGDERVLLRPRDRPLRPVVYFLNEAFPDELLETVRGVAAQWARVLNRGVWLAAGCKAADFGQSPCADRPEFDDPAFSMLVLCENSTVQAGDPPECGPVGRRVQLGDIRVSHIVWIDAPQQSSPLGYGPPLADPLTGETISAVANIYGASLETYATYATELSRMITDVDFPWPAYLDGGWQAQFVRANLADGGAAPEPAGRNKVGETPVRHRASWRTRTYTRADIERLYQQTSFQHALGVPGSTSLPPAHASKRDVQAWMNTRLNAITGSRVLGNGTNPQQGRINLLRDSYYEDLLMTRDYLGSKHSTLLAAGYDPDRIGGADIPPGSALRARVSPLTRLNLKYLRAIEHVKLQHYAQTVMYPEMVPFQEPSVIGVAAELVCGRCCAESERDSDGHCPEATAACTGDLTMQTARWAEDPGCFEAVKGRLRELIFDGVTLHEMGHNMGLRHNFKGSYDAMNYFDDYWAIRKVDGTIGPRSSDPRTPLENLSKIAQYQYTSIMDYGAKFNSDFEGLGRYDVAAINHAYSRFAQVFNSVNDVSKIAVVQNFRSFGWPTPIIFWDTGPEAINYIDLHYDPIIKPAGAVDTSEANRDWVPRAWIIEDPTLNDALITHRDVEGIAGNPAGRVMVPYQFCSDEFRNVSMGCNLFDEGADVFEITENQIQAYEKYYVFNNFGRDRYSFGWDEDAYPSRIVSRYFDIMQNHLQYYVLYGTILHDIGAWSSVQIQDFFTDPSKGWGSFTAAVARTFETFTRALFQPRPGCYNNGTSPDGTGYFVMESDPEFCDFDPNTYAFQIEQLDGKYWDDSWNFDLGYEWYLQQTRIGHFIDRPLAIQMMAYASNDFVGQDTQEDVRKFTINYGRVFPQHINVLFQAIQSGDLGVLAPSYCGQDSQGSAVIEHRDITNLDAPRCSLTGGTFTGYVDPGGTFTTQLNAAVFGMSLFPLNYSQEFIDKSRIYVRGSGQGVFFDPADLAAQGAELVTFQDPFSLKLYDAVRYPRVVLVPGEGEYSVSIGARLLDQAQAIKDRYEQALLSGDPNEIARTTTDLQNIVINLDMVRALTYLLEHTEHVD